MPLLAPSHVCTRHKVVHWHEHNKIKRSPNSYVGALWYKNQQNMLLVWVYHEDIAVLGQFYANLSLILFPQMQIAPLELRRQFMKLISLVCTNNDNCFGNFSRRLYFFKFQSSSSLSIETVERKQFQCVNMVLTL